MLKKKICRQCINDSETPWCKQDERNWRKKKVLCPHRDSLDRLWFSNGIQILDSKKKMRSILYLVEDVNIRDNEVYDMVDIACSSTTGIPVSCPYDLEHIVSG